MPKIGNGCIFKHTNTSGKTVWKVEVTIGKDFKGTRRRSRKTAPTYNDAVKLQRAMLAQMEAGTLGTTTTGTFETYAEWWLENVKALRVRSTTLTDYRSRLKLNAYGSFGHRRLDVISSRDLQEWLVSLRKQGKSTSTINGALQVVRSVFEHAASEGDLAKSPASLVRKLAKPIGEKSAVQPPWTLEETRMVLSEAKGTKFDLFITLGVLFGLRRGEILGLRWGDFNFVEGSVTVARGLKEAREFQPDGRARVSLKTDSPKTSSSGRKLYLSPVVLSAIQRHREYVDRIRTVAGDRWVDTEFVFVSIRGTPIYPTNMHKAFSAFLKSLESRHIRIHDMRHSSAVLGLSSGVRLEAVSQGLGHSRIDITKSIYAPYVQQLNDEFTRGLSQFVSQGQDALDVNQIALDAQSAR